MRQEFLGVEPGRIVHGHTEFDTRAYTGLYLGEMLGIHRHVGNSRRHRATYIAAYVVGVDMVGKGSGKAHYDILAGMHVGHDADFGILEHRMVDEGINQRQSLLFDIVCIDDAVFAVSSF